MKFILLILLILATSCSGNKKVYVCGDRPCLDKREFKEHFSKNLTIEIMSQQTKKDSNDLVQLNLKSDDNNKKKSIFSNVSMPRSKKNKIELKEAKIKLKKDKIKLKESRKARLKEERNKSKKLKKIPSKTDIKVDKKKTSVDKIASIKTKKSINLKKNINSIDEVKIYKSLCVDIKDCDIDKIADLLLKKGSQKKYPDITSE